MYRAIQTASTNANPVPSDPQPRSDSAAKSGIRRRPITLVPPPALLQALGLRSGPCVIDGRYRLGRKLGSGGSAAVYEAERLSDGRRVALKRLHAAHTDEPAMREELIEEAQMLGRVCHENVVGLHELGTEANGNPYLAMELVEGQTLHQLTQLEGPLDPAQACELVGQVLDALGALHARGLVHRDVKPANIMAARRADGSLRATLIDFGTVAVASTRTGGGTPVFGTPCFMAPEHAQGRAVDARTDVFSAAATLFRLLSGYVPITGCSAANILLNAARGEHRRLRDLNASVPAELAALVERAMSRDPAQRPQSARSFADELRQFTRRAWLGPVTSERCRSMLPIPLLVRSRRALAASGAPSASTCLPRQNGPVAPAPGAPACRA